jgi:ABC-type bacteriocin/lantibiotic exporter with double-glycine peptidase domain
MLALRDALRDKGFGVAAVEFNPRAPIPARLPMVLYLDRGHFVAAFAVDDDRVIVIDPPSNATALSRQDLAERWLGKALIVAATPEALASAMDELEMPR